MVGWIGAEGALLRSYGNSAGGWELVSLEQGWRGVMEKSRTGHDITEEACVGIDFCIKTLLSNNHKLGKK